MKRKLASIQEIKKIEVIPQADLIELAFIVGWKVVIPKGQFKVGDKVVYFEIDSVCPETDVFSDLKNCNYRVKTQKFRGQTSQGFCLSLEKLNIDKSVEIGTDLTQLLGITKYELPDEYAFNEFVAGPHPGYLHRSSEVRIQTIPDLLKEYAGTRCVATEKMDGTAASFSLYHGDYKICCHDKEVKKEADCCYTFIEKKHHIEEKMMKLGKNYAIQGEICGPGICKNRYNFKEYTFFVYDIFDQDNYEHLGYKELLEICRELELPLVPLISDSFILPDNMDDIEEFSKGISFYNQVKREGVVVRSYERLERLNICYDLSRLSIKIINPEYLIKREK